MTIFANWTKIFISLFRLKNARLSIEKGDESTDEKSLAEEKPNNQKMFDMIYQGCDCNINDTQHWNLDVEYLEPLKEFLKRIIV